MPEKRDPSKAPAALAAAALPDSGPDLSANSEFAVVYATFPTHETARAAARRLIERRLAACVNIIPGMTAVYEWEGELHEDAEIVALIKTRRTHCEAAIGAVREGHPYANPAAIVLDVSGGSRDYLDWLRSATAKPEA